MASIVVKVTLDINVDVADGSEMAHMLEYSKSLKVDDLIQLKRKKATYNDTEIEVVGIWK